jgi:hypothetical protein
MRHHQTFFLNQKNLENPNFNHLSTVKTIFLKNTLMQVFAVKDLFSTLKLYTNRKMGWRISNRARNTK